jgi:hypothetical protein
MNHEPSPLLRFLEEFQSALTEDTFRKVTLGKFRGELASIEHVYIRKVTLREGERFTFVYRYPDRDLTQNHTLEEVTDLLARWLGTTCLSASLFTSTKLQQLIFNRRGKPRWLSGPADFGESGDQHDRSKNRLLKDEEFLKPLGILDAQGKPKMQMGDKYRQIHHFIEILAPAIGSLTPGASLRVVDMGSGKGYLTFAIYAYLKQENFAVEVLGVELRQSLVDFCNRTAEECGFEHLKFVAGDISSAELKSVEILVALHACDTATDDAIYQGIAADAQLILVAPCCHKELRPQLSVPDSMKPLFKHGIQLDRMAEAITDALRAMYLEANGYVVRIQEFIALEHTMKNLLIVAAKSSRKTDREELTRQATQFGEQFGVTHQQLGFRLRAKS